MSKHNIDFLREIAATEPGDGQERTRLVDEHRKGNKTVLICGSRYYMSDKMLTFAGKIASDEIERGNDIICGDAPGVDFTVASVCSHRKVSCMVYTPWRLPRDMFRDLNLPFISTGTTAGHGDDGLKVTQGYYHRNKVMVDLADKVIAIWNGRSGGTKQTFQYAMSQNKEVLVYVGKNLQEYVGGGNDPL